jgi:hypothetical protein
MVSRTESALRNADDHIEHAWHFGPSVTRDIPVPDPAVEGTLQR